MRKLAYLLPALGALAIGACSSDSGRKQETFELLPGEPGTCAETVLSTNSDFCDDDCGASLKCDEADRGQIENCCVLQTAPKLDNKLTRSSRVEEYSGTGAPQLSCFTPAGYPTKIASGTGNTDTVTLTGVLKAFSGGCDLKGVTIEVYEVLRTGDPATDGTLGALVGTAHTTEDDVSTEVREEDDDCTANDDFVINRRYTYEGVPMNTELLVLTHGDGWRELYTYNLFITEGDSDLELLAEPPEDGDKGTYEKDIRALMEGDFNLIPQVAIGAPISAGNGALGGEIHDCGNVRLLNAVVETSGSRRAMIYFNDNEDNPMPENGRSFTGTTSVFAALDVRPGYQRLTATGLIEQDGETIPVTLGYYDVRVFADSVTSVTLKGLQPHQVP